MTKAVVCYPRMTVNGCLILPRFPKAGHGRVRRGFSLIELIAVIGIMSLLLVIGLSVFRRTGNEALRTGSDRIAAMIEQGRTTAITRRKPVALVMVPPGTAGVSGENWRLGLFELAEWKEDGPVSGTQVQRWQELPAGTGFFAGEVDSLSNVLDEPEISMEWKEGSKVGQFPMLVFSPRGRLLAPTGSESVVAVLGSGFYRDGQMQATGEKLRRSIRIGRVIARPWKMD